MAISVVLVAVLCLVALGVLVIGGGIVAAYLYAGRDDHESRE